MPKIIINTCVKNVFNQRINSSISSVYLSTQPNIFNLKYITWCINRRLIRLLSTIFTSILSTTKKQIFYLLNKTFTHYPQYLLIRELKEN